MTTHIHLAPRLKKCRTIPLLLLWAYMAWSRVKLAYLLIVVMVVVVVVLVEVVVVLLVVVVIAAVVLWVIWNPLENLDVKRKILE